MKQKFKSAFMDVAKRFSELSHARRLHVGAIVVKDDRIISIGYNGMPAGWDNDCEDRIYPNKHAGDFEQHYDEFDTMFPLVDENNERYTLKTKPEVLHAERNALDKLAKSNEGGLGAMMFVTHAPCLECAKSIYGAGISHVFYRESYRSNDGIQFLEKCGINVEQV
jgi:dCMP deaminase